MFNFVNEINNEIENLTEEITNIQRKIDQLKVGGLKGEEERKATISTLEVYKKSIPKIIPNNIVFANQKR